MNIRDKIHPSKQPAGATHYNEDWHCSETEGIQYFKVGADGYHFWSGGRWVIGNTRMPASTITPLPNLQIETYAVALKAVEDAEPIACTCGRRTPFAHNHAETCPCFHPQLIGRAQRIVPPEGATHVWSTGAPECNFYLKVNGDGVAVWQRQNGGFWQWLGRTLDDIAGRVAPLEVLPAPVDELGKVWDVLRAAGINSTSASEGVKLLVDNRDELDSALAGMLFEFDDGVNGGTESPLPVLNHARTLVDAKQWGGE